jgi:hypothetical protein
VKTEALVAEACVCEACVCEAEGLPSELFLREGPEGRWLWLLWLLWLVWLVWFA